MEKYLDRANKITSYLILVIWIYLGSTISNAADIRLTSGEIIKWSNLSAILKGEHLRAILVAYNDFSKKFNPITSKYSEKKTGVDSFSAYSLKIENYDIYIREGNEGYIVIFQLRLSDKFQIIMGSGGTTRYIIDRNTFELIKIEKQK